MDVRRSPIPVRQSEPPGRAGRDRRRSIRGGCQSPGCAAAALVVDRSALPAIEYRAAALFRRSSADGGGKTEARAQAGWIWERSEVRGGVREDDEDARSESG